MKVALTVVASLAVAGAFAAQLVRWLRVLQREHYVAASLARFLGRWTSPQVGSASSPERRNLRRPLTLSHVLFLGLVVGLLLANPAVLVVDAILYGWLCPTGLSLRGRTGALRWTRRSTTIAVVASAMAIAIGLLGALTPQPWLGAVIVVWAVPVLLDLATRLLSPYEDRRAREYVDRAKERLARVAPTVVGITGSYGKTSTKNHLAQLLDGSVVASPRSFNNRAGLSRAINENLGDGTSVFIAEMGTFGPGEIRSMCDWCPPTIAVVTAIGPVHLERMHSLDVIDAAKFEITERASVVVLNVDDVRLRRWIDRLEASGKRVVRAGSTSEDARVRVARDGSQWRVVLDGVEVLSQPAIVGVQASNLAIAIATAIELGADARDVLGRVGGVTAVANRANVATAPSGVVVIDDTFNANPSSAAAAIEILMGLEVTGRRVLVTPGMIELGRDQYGQNLSLARRARALDVELVVVGRTNALALAVGYERPPRRFDRREQAVAWVRENLVAGDAVLYLNDLPDNYP